MREHALIVTEEPKIANVTRSAKGTVEKPSKHVAQKACLNRKILDIAPEMLTPFLQCKAEEAIIVLQVAKPLPSEAFADLPRLWGIGEENAHQAGGTLVGVA